MQEKNTGSNSMIIHIFLLSVKIFLGKHNYGAHFTSYAQCSALIVSTSFFSSTTKCSRCILYISCPNLPGSNFSKVSWKLLLEKVLESQIWAQLYTVIRGGIASRNFYVYTISCVCM